MAIERWELKVKNKQNIYGDWQLDIIKVKSDPTFFSGDLQLVIETEKPKKVNHQSPEIWELAENQGVNCYLVKWSPEFLLSIFYIFGFKPLCLFSTKPSIFLVKNWKNTIFFNFQSQISMGKSWETAKLLKHLNSPNNLDTFCMQFH